MSDPTPVLDLELLAKMSALRSGTTTLDVFALGLVVASTPSRLERMRAALHHPDELANVAHAFKGVSATCGLRHLAAALERVEHTARQGLDASAVVCEAESSATQTLQAIDAYLEQKRDPIRSDQAGSAAALTRRV